MQHLSITDIISLYQVSQCASSLAPPTHGIVACTHGRKIGSVCNLTCFANYRLSGSSSRTCETSGNSANWSGSETSCTGKQIEKHLVKMFKLWRWWLSIVID